MKREFTPYFEEAFAKYKKAYQEYMGYTDEQMPSDEILLVIALNIDRETIIKKSS